MGGTTYRLIPQLNGQVSVEMAKSSGRPRIIPDFRDEAEANAWIIQTQRLINETFPYLFWDDKASLTRRQAKPQAKKMAALSGSRQV